MDDDFELDTSSQIDINTSEIDIDDNIDIVPSRTSKPRAPKTSYSKFVPKYTKPKSQSRPSNIIKQPSVPVMKQPAPFNDTTFEVFSNPSKRLPEPEVCSESDEELPFDKEDAESIVSSIPQYDNDHNQQNFNQDEPTPQDGFASIDDEKQDYIYKFHRMHSKGIKTSKKFNMCSDIREMRAEYLKLSKDANAANSVKFSRRVLLAFVSGAEFFNKRYDPVGVELNGWSESIMDNLNDGDYDNVFKKLHDKYAGKVNTPPEIELLLLLSSSAIMFHMTSKMFKGAPNLEDFTNKNPNFMNDIMQKINAKNQKPATNQPNQQSGFGPPPPISSSFMNNPTTQPALSELSFSSSDDDSSMQGSQAQSIRRVALSEGSNKRRGRNSKLVATSSNTIDL